MYTLLHIYIEAECILIKYLIKIIVVYSTIIKNYNKTININFSFSSF
jgi:hypothetical protein